MEGRKRKHSTKEINRRQQRNKMRNKNEREK
jgi:hypothetical protein